MYTWVDAGHWQHCDRDTHHLCSIETWRRCFLLLLILDRTIVFAPTSLLASYHTRSSSVSVPDSYYYFFALLQLLWTGLRLCNRPPLYFLYNTTRVRRSFIVNGFVPIEGLFLLRADRALLRDAELPRRDPLTFLLCQHGLGIELCSFVGGVVDQIPIPVVGIKLFWSRPHYFLLFFILVCLA